MRREAGQGLPALRAFRCRQLGRVKTRGTERAGPLGQPEQPSQVVIKDSLSYLAGPHGPDHEPRPMARAGLA